MHFTYTIALGIVSATRIVVTGYLLTFCQEPGEVNYSVADFRDLPELCRVVASGILGGCKTQASCSKTEVGLAEGVSYRFGFGFCSSA